MFSVTSYAECFYISKKSAHVTFKPKITCSMWCMQINATWHLTGGWSAGLGVVRRAVRQQRVDSVGWRSNGVHGQLLPEGFFLAPVGKPVVDPHFCDQIGAKALRFGGGDASLKTLGPAGENRRWSHSILTLLGKYFPERVQSEASCLSTCCTLLPKPPSPPCWGFSAARRPGTGFAGMRAPTWNGYVSFSCRRVHCPPRHQAHPCPDWTGWTLGKKTPDPDCLCLSYCCQNLVLLGWTLKNKKRYIQ